jgi:hypothetical protein
MQGRKAIPCLPPGDAGNVGITLKKQNDSPNGYNEFSTALGAEKPAPLLAA